MALSGAGCAQWNLKTEKAVKYETVSTNSQHDTQCAREKHAEALILLEGDRSPKHLAKAENLLNEALVADVTYGPAHNSLGMLYYAQGKLYLAAWEYEYAAKLMPEHAAPYNNLGLVYERAGKYDEAISYYSMAMSRDGDDPTVVGNLVRARMVSGDSRSDLKAMISDLALNHPDPKWQEWARDQVALRRFDTSSADLDVEKGLIHSEPNSLPVPIREEVIPAPYLELPASSIPSGA